VCNATSANAVLNETTLANMLASGNVTVSSVTAKTNIQVATGISWASAHGLTLDSYAALFIDAGVADNGTGALSLTTGPGSSLVFGPSGKIGFLGVSNALTINGQAYYLVNSLSSLATLAAAQHIALSKSFSAAGTTYAGPPVADLYATLEGLGNTITGLTINDSSGSYDGLVGRLWGTIADLRVLNATVSAASNTAVLGILVGYSAGTILRSSSSGTASGSQAYIGGLVGENVGTISRSFSSANVGLAQGVAGGLVGANSGSVSYSAATGAVGNSGSAGDVGGFVGYEASPGNVTNSFAWGKVNGTNSRIGGFAGYAYSGGLTDDYEAGRVSPGAGNGGGFVGDVYTGSISGAFYFTVTNPTLNGSGYGPQTGITGVSGIAVSNLGFSSTLWRNESVCGREQAVLVYIAQQQGPSIPDGYCN
jgi:hypothetical protein